MFIHVYIYMYTCIPSEPRTPEFVGPKMKTCFLGEISNKKTGVYTKRKNEKNHFFPHLGDVYKYLRKGKWLQITMEWRL